MGPFVPLTQKKGAFSWTQMVDSRGIVGSKQCIQGSKKEGPLRDRSDVDEQDENKV